MDAVVLYTCMGLCVVGVCGIDTCVCLCWFCVFIVECFVSGCLVCFAFWLHGMFNFVIVALVGFFSVWFTIRSSLESCLLELFGWGCLD